jgi:AcrR family transcriptional regulator
MASDDRSGAGRSRLERGARRRQLVEIGLELLAGAQFEEVGIDRIAEAAGISRGLLFHYFPTKRDFFAAVVAEAAERLLEASEPDPALEPLARLRASLAAYVDQVASLRSLVLAVLRGAWSGDAALRAAVERVRETIQQRVYTGLGLADPPPEVRTAVRGWIAFVEESTLDWAGSRGIATETLLRLHERVLLTVVRIAFAERGIALPDGVPSVPA